MSGSQHPGHPFKGPSSRVCLSWHISEGPSSVQKALFHSDCWGQSGLGLGAGGRGRDGKAWAPGLAPSTERAKGYLQQASLRRLPATCLKITRGRGLGHGRCPGRASLITSPVVSQRGLGFRGKWGRPLGGAWAGWRPHRTVPWAGLPECASSKSWDPNAPPCESPSLTSVVASVLLVNFQMAPVPLKATVGPCLAPACPPAPGNMKTKQPFPEQLLGSEHHFSIFLLQQVRHKSP